MIGHIPSFAQNRCSISDDWTYKGMPVIWMENDFLRIGVLAGRGGDIFEFYYKQKGLNLLLRLNRPLRNPQREFPQQRGTGNQFEDYYYGGWQVALPNNPAFQYRGAQLGQHGEVWLLPWKHAILLDTPEKVQLKLWARPVRIPILIKRTLTLSRETPTLLVEEKLISECDTDLDIMWGQHIAFGSPFLQKGGSLDVNATKVTAEPSMPANRRIQSGLEFDWPMVKNTQGFDSDMRIIFPQNGPHYSELAYLSGFPGQAHYTLRPEGEDFGFRVDWDGDLFKYLWLWEERYATQDAPWWGSVYAYALEPWTGMHSENPQDDIDKGNWFRLKAREKVATAIKAGIVNDYK